jgi:hypothetical protein
MFGEDHPAHLRRDNLTAAIRILRGAEPPQQVIRIPQTTLTVNTDRLL